MKARLLFHCHHELGLGHLVRSLALARALTRHFDVVLLAGGELPADLELPREVEVVPLPEGRRAETVLDAFRRVRPDVIIVELFPFGRKKLAPELLPMLTEARGPLVVCSLRDILVRGRSDQLAHDERAATTANALFDLVLVHADPALVRLEETFRPRTPLHVPVRYTGFVVPDRPLPDGPRTGPLVVSAGGGRFGGPLLRAARLAAPSIHERTGLRTRLVAGPFLPEDEWRALERDSDGDVDLVQSVPDLAAELAVARASLSQCGYNTALDVLRARVPALVAPFAAPGEDEQTRRASLLANAGTVRVVDDLAPHALAAAVDSILDTTPPEMRLDLDGARHTADLLGALVAERLKGAA
jgi:predicted glycosyltransferase